MAKKADGSLTDNPRPSRVVVLIDASPDALHALEAAAELAGRHHVPLLAVSVEEPDRARSAAFAFAREVGAVSGAIRSMDEALLSRWRERGPTAVRRAIENVAREAGVSWDLVVLRGRLVEEVLALSEPGDLLMLGRVGWSARLGRKLGTAPLVLARQAAGTVHICSAETVGRPGRIAVLIEDVDSARGLLATAVGRAGTSQRELVLLLAPRAEGYSADRLARIGVQGTEGWRIRMLRSTATGEVLRVLAEERAIELVVGRGGQWLNSPAAARLLVHWRMPVLVTPAG